MRNGLLGSIAALTAGAGLAFGQGPHPLPGPGILDGPPSATNPAAGPNGPMDGPAPFGPDGAPTSAAEGLFGSGPGVARPFERSWAKGDYLLWRVKNGPSTFPLIVSGTIPSGAVPGNVGTLILFGGRGFDFGNQSGARAEFGALLPGSNRVGVETDISILPSRIISTTAVSGPLGIPVLGAPFFNELTGNVDSLNAADLANPGRISGMADTMMWTAELNLFANLYRGEYLSWSVMTWFRHFNLAEGIVIDASRTIGSLGQTFLGDPLPRGATVAYQDRFRTTSHFYGWNLGGNAEYRWRCFAFDVAFQAALGDMHRSVERTSFSEATVVPGLTRRVPGGLLSAITNFGRHTDNVFSVIPELKLDVHYQLSRHIRLGFGYGILYASNVVRPGTQIDAVVNPTIVPLRPEFGRPLGTARPQQVFRGADYWAGGVNWSVTLMY